MSRGEAFRQGDADGARGYMNASLAECMNYAIVPKRYAFHSLIISEHGEDRVARAGVAHAVGDRGPFLA